MDPRIEIVGGIAGAAAQRPLFASYGAVRSDASIARRCAADSEVYFPVQRGQPPAGQVCALEGTTLAGRCMFFMHPGYTNRVVVALGTDRCGGAKT